MSWLFSKAMMEAYGSSRSLPELAEEYSEGTYSDGEPFAQLNVMPTPHKFWRNGKTMEFSDLSRFGLTLRLLTESHGEELLMSYLADFPVPILVAQGLKKGSMVKPAGYGWKWPGSLAKYDQNLCMWKTRQTSLFTELIEFSGIWPRWGLMLDGELLEQMPLVQTTKEKESGLWLTPRATDTGKGEKSETFVKRMGDRGEHCFQSLPAQIGAALHPEWVEWLMGWPNNWTSLKSMCKLDLFIWEIQHAKERSEDEELRAVQWPDDPAEMGQWEIRLNIREQEILLKKMQSAFSAGDAIPGKGSRSKARTKDVQTKALREMRDGEITEASQGWESVQQFREQYRVLVCQLPCCGTHSRGELGEEESSCTQEVSHLWSVIPAEEGSGQALQGEVLLRRNGKEISRTSMGLKFRSDRLKAVGNGQVPRCAAAAWHILGGE
jgi:hypothetical protein